MEVYPNHKGRALSGIFHGGAVNAPDSRLVADDFYDNTERADGRDGKPALAAQENPCPGARGGNDDVDCPALYPDSLRGDGQDNEGAAGEGRRF